MKQGLMQRALASDWSRLPPALQAHYQYHANVDCGRLTVEYPSWMQWPLNLLRLFGVLINRPERDIETTVAKYVQGHIQGHVQGEIQYWRRTLNFGAGREVHFNSFWQYAGGNQLVEYVNRFLGLRMRVRVDDGVLEYRGVCYVLRLFGMTLRLPNWLLLGECEIREQAISDDAFAMDFRLRHPLFGQIYRYCGEFSTRRNGVAAN